MHEECITCNFVVPLTEDRNQLTEINSCGTEKKCKMCKMQDNCTI